MAKKKKANQWELTIRQKVKSQYSNSIFDNEVKFRSDSLSSLTTLLDTLADFEPVNDTSYELSGVEEVEEPENCEGENNV